MRVILKVLVLLIVAVFSCLAYGFTEENAMNITSPAFGSKAMIPAEYTCQGEDINPPLEISGVPKDSKSLALIMDDPDAPMGTWVHWVVYNIPSSTTAIAEKTIPGQQAVNSFGKFDYGGPCPPSGTHRYFFKVYALNVSGFENNKSLNKSSLEQMMQGHILAQAELIGLYKKR